MSRRVSELRKLANAGDPAAEAAIRALVASARSDLWRAHPCTFAQHLTARPCECAGEDPKCKRCFGHGKRGYQRRPHLDVVGDAIQRAAYEGGQKITVSMPIRMGKTETTMWGALWYLEQFPDRKIMVIGRDADFATKLGRRLRRIVEQYGHLLSFRLSPDSKAAGNWETDQGGGIFCAGVGGGINGEGAHLLVIDDYARKAKQVRNARWRAEILEWYQAEAYPRLEPGGSVVIPCTRWHPRDLVGELVALEAGEWEVINFSALAGKNDPLGRKPGEALWPGRFDAAHYRKIREKLGGESSWIWRAIYQGDPIEPGACEFPAELFSLRFAEWPLALPVRVVALDPSLGRNTKSGDPSAIVSLGIDQQGELWVAADVRLRPTPAMVADFAGAAYAFSAHVAVCEGNLFQELLAPIVEEEARKAGSPLPCALVTNTAPKEVRIRRLGPWLRSGRVHFLEGAATDVLIEQAKAFPQGEHDDGPDALELALRVALELWGEDPHEDVHEALSVTY